MKSGTSSLHEYLDLLPEVCMSRPKEPAYLVPERFAWREQAWYEQYFTAQAEPRASPGRLHRTTRSGTCIPASPNACTP